MISATQISSSRTGDHLSRRAKRSGTKGGGRATYRSAQAPRELARFIFLCYNITIRREARLSRCLPPFDSCYQSGDCNDCFDPKAGCFKCGRLFYFAHSRRATHLRAAIGKSCCRKATARARKSSTIATNCGNTASGKDATIGGKYVKWRRYGELRLVAELVRRGNSASVGSISREASRYAAPTPPTPYCAQVTAKSNAAAPATAAFRARRCPSARTASSKKYLAISLRRVHFCAAIGFFASSLPFATKQIIILSQNSAFISRKEMLFYLKNDAGE